MKRQNVFLLRAISIALLAFMIFSFVACGNDTSTPSETTAQESNSSNTGNSTTDVKEETTRPDDLPDDLNLNKRLITILSRDTLHVTGEISVASQNGESVNDAVWNRELIVENRLNVQMENILESGDQYAISNRLRNDVKAGGSDYQIIANSIYSTIMYTGERVFRNLKDAEYLDLTKNYWSQGVNEAICYGEDEAQYLCTGAISVVFYRYMFATFFNRNLFESRHMESPYDTVKNRKWTLDYQNTLAANFYDNLNGNDDRDEADCYGFVSCQVLYVDPYWSSCKVNILEKDSTTGEYVYALSIEKLSGLAEKLIALWNGEGSYIYKSVNDSTNEENLAQHFASDRAAMTTLRLAAADTEYLRKMESYYGIVPCPMYDETQDGYATLIHDQFTAFGIASTVFDDDLFQACGALLEALASDSSQRVLPAYYEETLKGKRLNDEQAWDMLDLIYDTVYIDAGILYDKQLNSMHQWLRTIIASGTNTVSSQYSSQTRALNSALNKLNDMLASAAD